MAYKTFVFPGIVNKDPGSDYGIHFPDLPGCYSAGKDQEELLWMAQEALSLHLSSLFFDGEPIPVPSRLEDVHDNDPSVVGLILVMAKIPAATEEVA